MYAIYWHARDVDGIVCIQGHAQANTIESAIKILSDSKYMAANNDVTKSWWSCIVPPIPMKLLEIVAADALEIDCCEI